MVIDQERRINRFCLFPAVSATMYTGVWSQTGSHFAEWDFASARWEPQFEMLEIWLDERQDKTLFSELGLQVYEFKMDFK